MFLEHISILVQMCVSAGYVKLQQLVMQTQTVSPHHAEVNLTPECDGEPVPVHLLNRQINKK